MSFISVPETIVKCYNTVALIRSAPDPLSSALRMAFLLLLLIGATWLLGLMAVNSNVMLFHYLFAVCSCLQVVQMEIYDLLPTMATLTKL